jgi:spore germination cell wall hydrolase CwlJ-like protein
MRTLLAALCGLVLLGGAAKAESPGYHETQVICLTRNIYEEARGESVQAQIMVGLITMGRVRDEKWPGHFCMVVFQMGQFSWANKLHKLEHVDTVAWTIANMIARGIFDGRYAMPAKMECARWYKRTDGKGVSEKSKRFFETRLFPIGAFGAHTAYCQKTTGA